MYFHVANPSFFTIPKCEVPLPGWAVGTVGTVGSTAMSSLEERTVDDLDEVTPKNHGKMMVIVWGNDG